MKKILFAFVLLTSVMSMVMTEAHARRLGGSSFGRQSSNIGRAAPMQRQTPPAANQAQQAQKTAPASQQQPANTARSRWGGMLGGALLGLGLGALLSHLGIGGELAGMLSTILMVVLSVVAVRYMMRMFSRKPQELSHEKAAYAGGYSGMAGNSTGTPEIGSGLDPAARNAFTLQADTSAGSSAESVTWGIPADFDVPAFVRSAKTYFIRMQAAWDKANTDDLYEFTTPEMFAELKLQIQERGPSDNVTDVVSLDAELLGIETISGEYLASVKFTGTIRESAGAEAEPFVEIWNMTRSVSGKDGWVLAGIQQPS